MPANTRILSRIFLMISLGSVIACDPKRSTVGTAEYAAAHGVKPNQANRLKIGTTVFDVPRQYRPMPYTHGKIVSGNAEKLTVEVPLAQVFVAAHPPLRDVPSATIHIYANHLATEPSNLTINDLNKASWTAIRPRAELGLMEYLDLRDYPVRKYASSAQLNGNGGAEVVLITCTGPDHPSASECHRAYRASSGNMIIYYYSGDLLSQWKDVHAEVQQIVYSFSVK